MRKANVQPNSGDCALFVTMPVPTSVNWFRNLLETETVVPLANSPYSPGLAVIKLEYSIRLKIKRNDWLHADTCPNAANRCASF